MLERSSNIYTGRQEIYARPSPCSDSRFNEFDNSLNSLYVSDRKAPTTLLRGREPILGSVLCCHVPPTFRAARNGCYTWLEIAGAKWPRFRLGAQMRRIPRHTLPLSSCKTCGHWWTAKP